MAKVKPTELWKRCTDLALEKSDRFGPLHEAMRAATVVAVDDDMLILGISGHDQYLRGHLEMASNRHQVLVCLKELTGRELDYELIEGTTKEDWEHHKKARATRTGGAEPAASETIEVAAEAAAPAARAGLTGPWEEVMERLHYAYQQTQARNQPMVRAQFLLDVLPIVAEAESKAAQQGEPEERIQRSLTRVLERVGMLADVSSTQVALELLRQRGKPKAKPKSSRKKK